MKTAAILVLATVLSGCATLDKPFTPAQAGGDHIMTVIFIGLGESARAAADDNARLVASVGLPYRVLTRVSEKVQASPVLWDTRTEVQFLMTPGTETPPVPPPAIPAVGPGKLLF
jgi:hypothetical protein